MASKSTPKKTKTSKSRSSEINRLHPLDKQLVKEMRTLSKEVRNLKNLEFVKILKSPWKFLGLSLLKGMMVGLGTVIGASVLVGLFIYLLGQISFVPIIGDFVQDIISQIQVNQAQP